MGKVKKFVIDAAARMRAQLEEMMGDVNRWFTGLAVGHDPNPHEMALHYINSGGAEDFARRHENDFLVEVEEEE
ncbi:MAG: hypothetical protein QG665_395 [Patescibacteria group bacterium]|nr:hypothetical protein [Patescibacteria group bacterium]